MFEVGFSELIMVALVALLVVGPERLPRVVRETALWVRKARQMVGSVKQEIEYELRMEELKRSFLEEAEQERKRLSSLVDVERDSDEAAFEQDSFLVKRKVEDDQRT